MPAPEPVRPPFSSVPTPDPAVRTGIKALLQSSRAFNALPLATQQQVARDTALIADYLARPEGIPGNTLPGGLGTPPEVRALADPPAPPAQESFSTAREAVSEIGTSDFKAGAAREGADVAVELIKKVDFVGFVGGLIKGVFSSIVTSSIQQMEAYAKMVEQVSKSLQQFRDDNVSANQGRDHMVEKFPDMFEIDQGDAGGFSDSTEPRLKLKDGVDEGAALKRVRTSMKFEEGKLDSMDLSDENVEKVLVIAAQTQLARQRQQLLASLVIMGINRIVITEGKISAKIMYDFQARDARKLQRSAVARDYARDAGGNLALTRSNEGEYDSGGTYSRKGEDRDADYFAKGKYKYEEQPVLTAMSTASEASESQLQTRAQLSGAVEVNFKSDYLPLDKMATPGMIAAIQGNSTPVDPNVVPSVRQPQPVAAGTPPPAAPPATPPPAGT
jgi:hypothetical protein